MRSRAVPSARPKREFAPSATTTYARPHRLGRRRRAGSTAPVTRPSSTSGATASAPVQTRRRPAFTARVGDHLVEVAAAHDVAVGGEVGVLGPRELERHAVRDRAQAVEAEELRERLGEAHVVELADGPRREAVAAGLLAREALLLDDEHAVARPRRASTPAAAPAGPRPTTSTSHVGVVIAGTLVRL